jgi:NitT/TauT family transport system substrate-binding protein
LFGIASDTGRDRLRHIALALAAVMVVTGCGALGMDNSKASSSGSGLEKPTLKVSILPTTDLGPFWLAQDEGYFKDEGLNVESVIASSGQASLAKSISGEADIAFSTYPPFFTAKSTGTADMQLVADATSVNAKSAGQDDLRPGGQEDRHHGEEHRFGFADPLGDAGPRRGLQQGQMGADPAAEHRGGAAAG